MRRGPSVFRVNTCNLDHPAALRLYQRMGFRPVATRQVVFDPGV
jgi:predicted GNAT family acetyltransferase